MSGVRRHAAKVLIRWAGRWWDASYSAYVRRDRDGWPRWYEAVWNRPARLVDRYARPLALRLDHEAAVDQMVEEGWWG